MDLGEAGIAEEGAALVGLPDGRGIRAFGIGREIEDIAVTAGGKADSVSHMGLDLAGDQVAGDDPARIAIDQPGRASRCGETW